MAKAHKNPIFVLGDGCRELSSAATSPAGCIWQQCARQQIAATYHATCRRAYYREQAATQPAAKTYLPLIPPCIPPCIPPWRYRRGATAKSYSRGTTAKSYRRHACRRACCRNLPPCMLPQPAAKTYLPGTLPAAKTYLPLILPCILPQPTRRAYYRAMGPAPSGRVIRM